MAESEGTKSKNLKLIFAGVFCLIIIAISAGFYIYQSKNGKTDHNVLKGSVFSVINAMLTRFDYSNNTLYYNLNLNMSNSVYCDYINAGVSYQNTIFVHQNVDTSTMSSGLNLNFQGQHPVTLDKDQVTHFNKEHSSGVYHINVVLCLRFKQDNSNPMILTSHCDLQVPLQSSNGKNVFHATQCDTKSGADPNFCTN
ncbi:hypothetical protein VNO78_26211 [Psophocarpus tetragonolobus]|uniref:Late embryogenesis abundant protein LEA-2 subgroup domain-containing protein n=1 Tax=Psophocarpus tetragonolobus TaxID=3891 RepID=A0AAN9RZH4_PSOTE